MAVTVMLLSDGSVALVLITDVLRICSSLPVMTKSKARALKVDMAMKQLHGRP
ncbi:MAG: hypothetical protein FWG26_07640 [Betaproteobacteria bacterium]|nr:hypothetical protein [Betaproteobacteria bacterium]